MLSEGAKCIDIDPGKLKKMKKEIIELERNNIKTGEKTDSEMGRAIRAIIERIADGEA